MKKSSNIFSLKYICSSRRRIVKKKRRSSNSSGREKKTDRNLFLFLLKELFRLLVFVVINVGLFCMFLRLFGQKMNASLSEQWFRTVSYNGQQFKASRRVQRLFRTTGHGFSLVVKK